MTEIIAKKSRPFRPISNEIKFCDDNGEINSNVIDNVAKYLAILSCPRWKAFDCYADICVEKRDYSSVPRLMFSLIYLLKNIFLSKTATLECSGGDYCAMDIISTFLRNSLNFVYKSPEGTETSLPIKFLVTAANSHYHKILNISELHCNFIHPPKETSVAVQSKLATIRCALERGFIAHMKTYDKKTLDVHSDLYESFFTEDNPTYYYLKLLNIFSNLYEENFYKRSSLSGPEKLEWIQKTKENYV